MECPTCGTENLGDATTVCTTCGAELATGAAAYDRGQTVDSVDAVHAHGPTDEAAAGAIGTEASEATGGIAAGSSAPPPPPAMGTPPPPPPPPPAMAGSGYGAPAYGSPGGYGSAVALSSEVRNWGMAAHLSAFLGAWVALAFVGPLAVWLLKREEHPFIAYHAREALNFNLSVLLYGAISAVLILAAGLGLLLLVALGIGWIIFVITAAVRASSGESYRYPMTIRFIN